MDGSVLFFLLVSSRTYNDGLLGNGKSGGASGLEVEMKVFSISASTYLQPFNYFFLVLAFLFFISHILFSLSHQSHSLKTLQKIDRGEGRFFCRSLINSSLLFHSFFQNRQKNA